MTIGIYMVKNKINDKVYVGQSIDIEKRFEKHKKYSDVSKLREDIEIFGVENFEFKILGECNETSLLLNEKLFIDKYNSTDEKLGYNTNKGSIPRYFDNVKNKGKFIFFKPFFYNGEDREFAGGVVEFYGDKNRKALYFNENETYMIERTFASSSGSIYYSDVVKFSVNSLFECGGDFVAKNAIDKLVKINLIYHNHTSNDIVMWCDPILVKLAKLIRESGNKT